MTIRRSCNTRHIGISSIAGIDPTDIVCLDLETTGLSPKKDEILQIAMVRGDRVVLLDSLIRPVHTQSWAAAEKVNGITRDMVSESPSIDELSGHIGKILSNCKLLVGFNLRFDLKFLSFSGIDISPVCIFDVMREFAAVSNRIYERRGHRFSSLRTCARHYGIGFNPHNAISDAFATLECFFAILDDRRP